MTDIKMNAQTGAIITNRSVPPGPAVTYDDAAVLKITTPVTDGVPKTTTSVSDTICDLTGRLSTARLRDLAAALVEHADAIDAFAASYKAAEWTEPEPKPVEVFPGFPLHLTHETLDLKWPDGVRARDRDGDAWQFVTEDSRWVWVHPEDNEPRFDNMARIERDLPATIIPTSWPTAAADTTPEN